MVGRPPIEAEADTRVSGRRVVQYVLDVLLIGIVVYAISYIVDQLVPGAGFEYQQADSARQAPFLTATGGGWSNPLALSVTPLITLVVFTLVPAYFRRTPAMALVGLWIVRTDGGRPSTGQHMVRTIFLLIDSAFGGLVGLLVMLFSARRQRVGDHVAGTLVVRTPYVQQPTA